ncbi:MAG: four helix bundle protein [Chloroflexi bacterium]|nr:four helix bundle protein [Chloroflexota bacterium]MCL5274415.1 four helix bundle protein [Chloroflexota bacterium]
MNYAEWEQGIPPSITSDSLWKMSAYRLSLFLGEIGWYDATRLAQDRRTVGLSDQLYRANGSISANIAEGYSRGSGKDRARFYQYALGSARESRDWYYKARHILGATVTNHRLQYLVRIIQLLLTMIPQQRGNALHEDAEGYTSHQPEPVDATSTNCELLYPFIDVPLPESSTSTADV